MITATVKKEVERRTASDPYDQIEVREVEFETIGELEKYLAYHRSYIRAIEFKGKIEEKED